MITPSLTKTATVRQRACSPEADAEIHAYIAARDMALAEAERQVSDATLNRAFLANQLVDNYLKPAPSPYEGQALSDPETMRERHRCEKAKVRIAQLRANQATDLFHCAVAA